MYKNFLHGVRYKNIFTMKRHYFVVFSLLLAFFLMACHESYVPGKYASSSKKSKLSGTTWYSVDENYRGIRLVSFDNNVAYVINQNFDDLEAFSDIMQYFAEWYGNEMEHILESYNWIRGLNNDYEPLPIEKNRNDFFLFLFEEYENIDIERQIITGANKNRNWEFAYLMDADKLILNIPERLNPDKFGPTFLKRIVGNSENQPIGIWLDSNKGFFLFTNPEVVKRWSLGTYVSWEYTCNNDSIMWSGNSKNEKLPYQILNETDQIKLIFPGETNPITLTLSSSKFNISF